MCNKALFLDVVSILIDKLNMNCAPVIDRVTKEHLNFGKSNAFCSAIKRVVYNHSVFAGGYYLIENLCNHTNSAKDSFKLEPV